jgi:NADH dehydrogenase (ubiquinone) 1 beta subcomplex subunit 3
LLARRVCPAMGHRRMPGRYSNIGSGRRHDGFPFGVMRSNDSGGCGSGGVRICSSLCNDERAQRHRHHSKRRVTKFRTPQTPPQVPPSHRPALHVTPASTNRSKHKHDGPSNLQLGQDVFGQDLRSQGPLGCKAQPRRPMGKSVTAPPPSSASFADDVCAGSEAWRYTGPFTRWNRFKGSFPGLGIATVAFAGYCVYEAIFLKEEHHHGAGHGEGHH